MHRGEQYPIIIHKNYHNGQIAEKSSLLECILIPWHYILSARLTKTHFSFRLLFRRFCPLGEDVVAYNSCSASRRRNH